MIDNPAQVPLLADLKSQSGGSNKPLAFLKIDVRYNRAGTIPGTPTYHSLLEVILASEAGGECVLHGVYAHAGQSYYTRGDWDALAYLTEEFATLARVAGEIRARSPAHHKLTLSVGATPTATALQHPDITTMTGGKGPGGEGEGEGETGARVASLSSLLGTLKADGGLSLEVHAGVYPTLDLQQLATHARDSTLLGSGDIAVTVVAEVASLYEGRGEGGSTEALVNAGSLALGREPCKEDGEGHYAGWGVVAPWGEPALERCDPAPRDFPAVHGGWQVGKISQEHGVLVWKGAREAEVPLKFGQRVRIWPNHACIAGAGYDHYLVVDSRRTGKEDEVVDVWPRWNGW
jgi:D-serine ammonia-lyase